MAIRINDAEITKRFLEFVGSQTARDGIPDQLAKTVVPTISINLEPKIQTFSKQSINSGGGSLTIHTCKASPTRTFLTFAQISLNQNVACDNDEIELEIVGAADGIATELLRIIVEDLTAHSGLHAEFVGRIELEPGSAIKVRDAFGLGIATKHGSIVFEEIFDPQGI